MSDILEIVLLNASNHLLNPIVLCKTACLNKNFQALSKRIWDFIDVAQYKPFVYGVYNCRFCQTKPADLKVFGCCRKCSHEYMNIITTTDAKKKYHLNDDDLGRIPCHVTIHKLYRNIIKLFDETEVALFSLYKFKPKPILKLKNSMKEPRIKKVEATLNCTLDTIDRKKYNYCIDGYVRNGRGGIKNVKSMLLLWDAFETLLQIVYIENLPEHEIDRVRDEFIYGHITSDEVVNRLNLIRISMMR